MGVLGYSQGVRDAHGDGGILAGVVTGMGGCSWRGVDAHGMERCSQGGRDGCS